MKSKSEQGRDQRQGRRLQVECQWIEGIPAEHPVCCSVTFPNSTCSANQTVRLRMTPTTAAVIAASAPVSIRLARNCSTKGAPAKIHSIEALNVTQVVIAAAITPAVDRRERRSFTIACEETHELRNQDQRAGRCLGEAQPVDHFLRRHPALRVDRFLRHIGEQRIGAPEAHHCKLREKRPDSTSTCSRPSVAAASATGVHQATRPTTAAIAACRQRPGSAAQRSASRLEPEQIGRCTARRK